VALDLPLEEPTNHGERWISGVVRATSGRAVAFARAILTLAGPAHIPTRLLARVN
jgi:hypothetical protein